LGASFDLGPAQATSLESTITTRGGRLTRQKPGLQDYQRIDAAIEARDTPERRINIHVQDLFEETINSGTLSLTAINEQFSDHMDAVVRPITQAEIDSSDISAPGDLVISLSYDDVQQKSVLYQALARAKKIAYSNRQSTVTASHADVRKATVTRSGTLPSGTTTEVASSISSSGGSAQPQDQTKNAVTTTNVIGSDPNLHGGIVPKDRRRASLQITPQSSSPSLYITDFFITSIREEDNEKYQVVETFGTNFLFFYGRRPRIYTVSGILVNAKNRDWKNEFKANYDSILRGTQLAKSRRKAVFGYDDVIREGYILSFSHQISAENPNSVPFSFSLFVTREAKAAGEANG
jgi:hypothetical protein